jgi:hypothetical protein
VAETLDFFNRARDLVGDVHLVEEGLVELRDDLLDRAIGGFEFGGRAQVFDVDGCGGIVIAAPVSTSTFSRPWCWSHIVEVCKPGVGVGAAGFAGCVKEKAGAAVDCFGWKLKLNGALAMVAVL